MSLRRISCCILCLCILLQLAACGPRQPAESGPPVGAVTSPPQPPEGPPADSITYIGIYPAVAQPSDGDAPSFLPVSYVKDGVQRLSGDMGPYSHLAETVLLDAPAAESLRLTDGAAMYCAGSEQFAGFCCVASSGDWVLFPAKMSYCRYTAEEQPDRPEWTDYVRAWLDGLGFDSPAVISEAWLFDWNGRQAAVVTASNVAAVSEGALLTKQDDFARSNVPSGEKTAVYTVSALFTAGNAPVELYSAYLEVPPGPLGSSELGLSYRPPDGDFASFQQFISVTQYDESGDTALCPVFCDHGGELNLRTFRYRPGFLLCDLDGDGETELVANMNGSSSLFCTSIVFRLENGAPQRLCSITAN